MSQEIIRKEMDVGCEAADKIWNANRRRMTDGFFAGMIMKLLTLYAAGTTPSQMAKVWDSVSRAVQDLNKTAQTEQ
jgi:hypothetical protein